jgi:hypothetical protein
MRKRKSRGRNLFTLAATRRAAMVAQERGVDLEIRPDGTIKFHTGKQGTAAKAAEVDEWDAEYGANQAEVRLPAAK